jgi:hypothetical protein
MNKIPETTKARAEETLTNLIGTHPIAESEQVILAALLAERAEAENEDAKKLANMKAAVEATGAHHNRLLAERDKLRAALEMLEYGDGDVPVAWPTRQTRNEALGSPFDKPVIVKTPSPDVKCPKPGCGAANTKGHPCSDWDCPQRDCAPPESPAPTPETDAAWKNCPNTSWRSIACHMRDFARKLERERAEAASALKALGWEKHGFGWGITIAEK